MPAYLVLAGATWAVVRAGGTSAPDLGVVLTLLALAAWWSPGTPRMDPRIVAATVLLLGWLILDGPVRAGWNLQAVRLPLLVVAVALTVLAVVRLEAPARETLLTGLIVLGVVQATWACAEAVPALVNHHVPRADAQLGSANALGVILVATTILAARRAVLTARAGWWVAVAVQAVGVFATGSRTAAVLLLLATVTFGLRHARRALGVALTVCVATAAGILLATRSATGLPEQRPSLWSEALQRIAAHPLVGSGPVAHAYAVTMPGARVTTHAHDEPLQWTVDYGLIGLGLAAVVVVLLILQVRAQQQRPDPWLLGASCAVLAAGLTDFGLRVTALAVIATVLAVCAVRRPATAGP
jgi:hypothetical protein